MDWTQLRQIRINWTTKELSLLDEYGNPLNGVDRVLVPPAICDPAYHTEAVQLLRELAESYSGNGFCGFTQQKMRGGIIITASGEQRWPGKPLLPRVGIIAWKVTHGLFCFRFYKKGQGGISPLPIAGVHGSDEIVTRQSPIWSEFLRFLMETFSGDSFGEITQNPRLAHWFSCENLSI